MFGLSDGMPVDWITQNAPYATFEGRRNQGRPRMRWIDHINENGFRLILRQGALDFTTDRKEWRLSIITHHPPYAGYDDYHNVITIINTMILMIVILTRTSCTATGIQFQRPIYQYSYLQTYGNVWVSIQNNYRLAIVPQRGHLPTLTRSPLNPWSVSSN